jgi:hypothetical protein
MSSTLTPALVAEPALALARTKQSLKTNLMNETALKERKACQNRLFLIFLADFESLAKYLLSLHRSLNLKRNTLKNNLIIN